MIPDKLKKGDHVRVIAPSHSFPPEKSEFIKKQGKQRLEKLGLKVSFGKYVDEFNDFSTTTVEHRLEDLHEAFADPEVQAIIPAKGGSSGNQLLKYIDYELIKRNPKIICGLSDITEVAAAIYAKTGIVTYYGPHFTMLAASKIVDYSLENMRQTFFSEEVVRLQPSEYYSNSEFDKEVIVNDGFWTINEGSAEGSCVGGNLMTVNCLTGSEFMPELEDRVVFLEENKVIDFRGVQKELQAILNQRNGSSMRGLVIGRFQRQTGMDRELLTKLIQSKKELEEVPVIANIDFGHTTPMVTFPIGGKLKFEARGGDKIKLQLLEH